MENTRLVIFDVDGTLLPGTSCERLFFQYLIDKKILGFRNLFSFILSGLWLMRRGKTYAIKANKGYLRGFDINRVTDIGKSFFDSQVVGRISKKGITRLNEHKEKNDIVFLLSGMPEFLLANFAEHLKVENYQGSVLDIDSDKFTGKTKGIFPLSRGKARIVESLLGKFKTTWANTTAYADHYGDRYMLDKVGHPVAVNPDPNLALVAREKGWPTEIFD